MIDHRSSSARLVIAIAALLGFFASAYLFYAYATGAPITCAIVSGCEAVRSSKWAYTFGIPRPFLGLIFYVGVFALLVIRTASSRHTRLLRQLTVIVAALGFVESAFLFGVQWLDIKAFCLWCLISAVCATVIAIASFFDRESAPSEKELQRLFVALLVFLPLAALGMWGLIR